MTEKRTAAIPQIEGHTLRGEGAAFTLLRGGGWIRTQATVGGQGSAVCQCGASSFEYTQTERKAWHREHRRGIIEQEREAGA